METPAQTCARLVAALEDLVAQEAATLEARDFATVVHLQERAAPLVEHLATHSAEVVDVSLRERIRMLLERRQQSGEWLAAQIEQTKEALRLNDERRHRVTQIAPAYGRSRYAPQRFSAVG
jgi:hypothetical protein